MTPGDRDASRADSNPGTGPPRGIRWRAVFLALLVGVPVLWVGTLGASGTQGGSEKAVSVTSERDIAVASERDVAVASVEKTGDRANGSSWVGSDTEDPTCNRCHDVLEPNPRERQVGNEVSNQPDHAFEFDHGSQMWCLDCHARNDRNRLRLPNGSVVDWTTQMEIQQCGSCHGPVYTDWQAGIHGSWNGSWTDPEPAETCTDCHDPHDPGNMTIEPEPAPERPPPGPDVARAVLPGGYYTAVGFLGAIAAGLIGYAGLALRRDHDG